ncbi:MAG: thiamine phosphate synthase [Bacilli bacterium]
MRPVFRDKRRRRACGFAAGVGLHIGQDDIPPQPPANYRRRPRAGLSTHSIEQAKSADALNGILDYFAVGPCLQPTQSQAAQQSGWNSFPAWRI